MARRAAADYVPQAGEEIPEDVGAQDRLAGDFPDLPPHGLSFTAVVATFMENLLSSPARPRGHGLSHESDQSLPAW